MKIRIVKPNPDEGYEGKTKDFLKHNTIIIDLHEFWKQHDIDDKEYFLEKFIKERLKD
jgi:hypothetical protein